MNALFLSVATVSVGGSAAGLVWAFVQKRLEKRVCARWRGFFRQAQRWTAAPAWCWRCPKRLSGPWRRRRGHRGRPARKLRCLMKQSARPGRGRYTQG